MAQSNSLTIKHWSRHQNHYAKWFSSNVMMKMYFCKMVANVTHLHTSCVEIIQDFFFHLKAFTQATLCLYVATFCP